MKQKKEINWSTNSFLNSWLTYMRKYWFLFILGIIILVILITENSLAEDIMYITIGLLGIYLTYTESPIIFDSPWTNFDMLVIGKTGFKILIYLAGSILVIVGITLILIG